MCVQRKFRPRLWPSLAFIVVFAPIWLAWVTELQRGGRQLEEMWGSVPVLYELLLFVLVPSPVFRPAGTLSEDHEPSFQYAVRTGTLPLASLFGDWTEELMERRCGLERALRALPTCMVISAGCILDATADRPTGCEYFIACGATAVFLGIVLMNMVNARLANLCSLEVQLQLQRQHLAMTAHL
jgi:hypothetical protein